MQVLIGVVGVGLAWGLAGAQWWRARRSSAGISVATWVVFLAANLAWLGYAVGTRNPYLVANTVGAAGCNVALLARIDAHRVRDCGAAVACGLFVTGLGVVLGWPVAAGACFTLAFSVRWPQLVRAVGAADLSGISLTSWGLALVNSVAWVTIGLVRHDLWLAAANTALGVATMVLIAVVLIRRRAQAVV